MNCENCKFWNGGKCHRNPPTLLPWLAREQGAYDPIAVAATETYCSEWPETKSTDYCGEFEVK